MSLPCQEFNDSLIYRKNLAHFIVSPCHLEVAYHWGSHSSSCPEQSKIVRGIVGWRSLKTAFHKDAPTDLIAIRPWVSALLEKDRKWCCMRLIRKKAFKSRLLIHKRKISNGQSVAFLPSSTRNCAASGTPYSPALKSYRGINTVRINTVQSSKMSQVHFKKGILQQRASFAFTTCSPSVLTPWFPNTSPTSLK